ncbi:MAG: sulfotransferase [Asgard group archaeon]|nr:sulfotransferase [Asgard group archaeon]
MERSSRKIYNRNEKHFGKKLTTRQHTVNLIFITYVNRSGSTFLANEFSKYNDILVCPEAEILIDAFLKEPDILFEFNSVKRKFVERILSTDRKLKYWGLEIQDVDELSLAQTNFEAFIKILTTYKRIIKPDADTIVFKGTELIYLYQNLIQKYPELQFVSIIRDGRASFTSQMNTISPHTNKPFLKNPLIAAWNWNKLVDLSLQFENGKDFIIVKYEDLIHQRNETLESLFIRLGIKQKISKRVNQGDLYNRLPDMYKRIHNRIQNDPEIERIEMWKKNGSQILLYLFEETTINNICSLGYDPNNYQVNNTMKYVYRLYFRLNFMCVKIRLVFARLKNNVINS